MFRFKLKQFSRNISFVLFLAVFAFIFCQILINLYIYPAIVPDEFLIGLRHLSASINLWDDAQTKIIFANIKINTMDTFEGGEFKKRFDILATGNPSLSPTPTGEFEILTKYPKAFSKLSQVWMPWSMRFFKQYYIHEVPYYSSGAKVKSRYSLGCIRLGENDAEEIYSWAELGTKVKIISAKLVREENDPMVFYLTQRGFKKPILSEKVFNSYGNKWEDVAVVPNGWLAGYPDVELIREENGVKVYKLGEGKKRWIKDIETFENLNYKWEEIAPVNKTELDLWPEGEELGMP